MNRYSIRLMHVLLLFATGITLSMEQIDPAISIYVTNAAEQSGKKHTIFVQTELRYDIEQAEPHQRVIRVVPEQIKVPFGESTYVGQLNQIIDVLTSGDDVFGWTMNQDTLNKIKQEAFESNIQNKDIYLYIVSGNNVKYYINSWSWADKKNITSISLDHIKRGFLGQEYARMVRDICSADYKKAVAAGSTNLCEYLKRRLQADVLKGAPSDIKDQKEAIKRIIDGIYAQLKMYRTPQGLKGTILVR